MSYLGGHRVEPKIGAILTTGFGKPRYFCVEAGPADQCGRCDYKTCRGIKCAAEERKDRKNVIFKKVQECDK